MEIYDAVAIGMRGRFMDQLNALAVVELHFIGYVRFRGPQRERGRRYLAGRRAHSLQHVFMGQDRSSRVSANLISGLCQFGVPAGVIGIETGVDDVSNRLTRNLFDSGEYLRC